MKILPFLILMFIFSFTTITNSQTTSSNDGNRQSVKTPVKETGYTNNFQSDGCTMWFDRGYKGCCEKHDLAYFKSNGWHARLAADNQLFMCVAKKGISYAFTAPVIWLGVRIFGSPWFPIHKKRK